MHDKDLDRSRLLPRSGLAVLPPWLIIAPPGNPIIRLDLRALDLIAVRAEHDNEPDEDDVPGDDRRSDVVLVCGDLEVAIYIADGPDAVAEIVRQARPFTRETAQLEAGTDRDPVLFIGGQPLLQRGEYLCLRDRAFRIGEVRDYALQGANVPLADGGQLQAALALIVVATEERVTRAGHP